MNKEVTIQIPDIITIDLDPISKKTKRSVIARRLQYCLAQKYPLRVVGKSKQLHLQAFIHGGWYYVVRID